MSVTETPPAWIADRIHASQACGRFRFYLGSMPLRGNIATHGEQEREDYLTKAAAKLGLILHEDHRNDRRYIFVERSPDQRLDHGADASHLVFGELETGDSEGFVCTMQSALGSSPERDLPVSSWAGPHSDDDESEAVA